MTTNIEQERVAFEKWFSGKSHALSTMARNDSQSSHQTGRAAHVVEQEPVAWIPIHPRSGPLWGSLITSFDQDRPSYPLMPLHASPHPASANDVLPVKSAIWCINRDGFSGVDGTPNGWNVSSDHVDTSKHPIMQVDHNGLVFILGTLNLELTKECLDVMWKAILPKSAYGAPVPRSQIIDDARDAARWRQAVKMADMAAGSNGNDGNGIDLTEYIDAAMKGIK